MASRRVLLARCLVVGLLALGVPAGCGEDPELPSTLVAPGKCSVELSPSTDPLMANGQDTMVVTVTVRNEDARPLSGRVVIVQVGTGEGFTLLQEKSLTDSQGQNRVEVRATTPGNKTLYVSVNELDGVRVHLGEVVVDFR
ncbi:Ig-like domain-containing protein [Corallococcus carmarthensis]|uniref:Ig-like domain-containing protein n=1 Tax=Corallococcus carmarthensis TaxID=2316728 RepID=UPI00148E7F8C|nr:Ig-like domain-containing protein [Corallococcus carmarthensis]NOK21302.1 Ig-like domain-containing protein [Corallococcus carmarthensis]